MYHFQIRLGKLLPAYTSIMIYYFNDISPWFMGIQHGLQLPSAGLHFILTTILLDMAGQEKMAGPRTAMELYRKVECPKP